MKVPLSLLQERIIVYQGTSVITTITGIIVYQGTYGCTTMTGITVFTLPNTLTMKHFLKTTVLNELKTLFSGKC
jgi:hypothetical protein